MKRTSTGNAAMLATECHIRCFAVTPVVSLRTSLGGSRTPVAQNAASLDRDIDSSLRYRSQFYISAALETDLKLVLHHSFR